MNNTLIFATTVVVGFAAPQLPERVAANPVQTPQVVLADRTLANQLEYDLDEIALAGEDILFTEVEATTKKVQEAQKRKPVQQPVKKVEAKVLGAQAEPVVKPAAPAPEKPQARAAMAPHELDGLFEKYGAQYGVDPQKLKVIAKCESGFNAGVQSKNGLYGGMYQYLASTWSGTRKQMGENPDPALRFNAEEAIKTTAWKISKGGIGAWPVCGKK